LREPLRVGSLMGPLAKKSRKAASGSMDNLDADNDCEEEEPGERKE
jgi:hypothetical protein